MKRHEAMIAICIAVAFITAGLVWLFDGYGLIGPGVAILVTLFVVDIKEE